MSKDQLRALLAQATEAHLTSGGEIVRYASPSKPSPIKTGSPYRKPDNLKQKEWEDYLQALKDGTYQPEHEDYQASPRDIQRFQRQRSTKNVKLGELI
jgi:hypothetical protein